MTKKKVVPEEVKEDKKVEVKPTYPKGFDPDLPMGKQREFIV